MPGPAGPGSRWEIQPSAGVTAPRGVARLIARAKDKICLPGPTPRKARDAVFLPGEGVGVRRRPSGAPAVVPARRQRLV